MIDVNKLHKLDETCICKHFSTESSVSERASISFWTSQSILSLEVDFDGPVCVQILTILLLAAQQLEVQYLNGYTCTLRTRFGL